MSEMRDKEQVDEKLVANKADVDDGNVENEDDDDEEEEDDDDNADGDGENVSIEKILEGMTNEFNKTLISNNNDDENDDDGDDDNNKIEDTNTKSNCLSTVELDEQNILDVNNQTNLKSDCLNDQNLCNDNEDKISKNNSDCQTIEDVDLTNNKTVESVKKDNIPRIVLTFRTIDENTNDGRKTKISSCVSNLSLVPDELSNCDQIGGVSVKLEQSDDQSDTVDKSDEESSNNNKNDTVDDDRGTKSNDSDIKSVPNHHNNNINYNNIIDHVSSSSNNNNNSNVSSNNIINNNNEEDDDNDGDEDEDNEEDEDSSKTSKNPVNVNNVYNKRDTVEAEQEDEIKKDYTIVVRKRRRRRRVFSDSNEEFPGPKRSARRLCKETNRSTVLESAMARKEKSNSTEEVKKRKKYTRPGRPKRIVKETIKPPPTSLPTTVPSTVTPATTAATVMNTNLIVTNSNVPTATSATPPAISATDIANSNVQSTPNNSLSDVINCIQSDVDYSTDTSKVNSKDLSASDLSNSSDFDGMPKLFPVVKKPISNLKVSNESVSDDKNPVKNYDKPFVRPLSIGKGRRDRGRPRSNHGNRKVAKTDLIEESHSSGAEAEKINENTDFPEDYNTPSKRTRRSLPSPSPAEGQASKPESTAVFDQSCEETLVCLCHVQSQLHVTISGLGGESESDDVLYCTAIDSIDNRLIGCSNQVDPNDVSMRRPSTRVPFIILCQSHKERLLRHNCCPSCGLFCTQGKFVQCINGHQFHHDCEIYINKKPSCPHCNHDYSIFDVIITISGSKKPVLVPTRHKLTKIPSAKMSLPGRGDNIKLVEQTNPPLSPLIKPDVIKIPEPTLSSDRPERYTIMSLYTAVKHGDIEKLVNVLACGYNANHTYKEYSHRCGLHIAADKGHLNCVHVLVQAGAQIDVMDKNQLTPLMLAAIAGKIDVVRYLVRVGADVTLKGEDGMTALHMAAKAGHLDACKIILSECKVPKTLVDCVDDGGWTSLIWACEFRHSDVARYLIEKKCDPLIRDAEQNIALHWSAYSGSSEITEMLLNEGCDVNAVNVHGDTPLHIAARQDKYAVSVLLLARGAKITEVNAIGETAINCCSNDGDTLAALKLNAKINSFAEHIWEKTIKILTNDISRGKEMNPIQCVNGFDSEDKPTDFLYVIENCFTSNINIDRTITSLQSCHCEDNCSSEKCLCGNISLRCWYDEEGKLIPEFNYADPPMLFECNQACACNRITCNNRVVQHGLTQRFQLFRTRGKGWGLKTLRYISKGSYVCEYVGEIISDSEADLREDDSYLFDLDNRDGETYCIDARRYGNLARFINHSCSPNLLPVRVFVEHQDLHFPRIAFFANRDIEANEELGFDYGEKFWIIKYKSFTCTCGALNCKYSEKTIQFTLDNYRKKIQQEEILLQSTN